MLRAAPALSCDATDWRGRSERPARCRRRRTRDPPPAGRLARGLSLRADTCLANEQVPCDRPRYAIAATVASPKVSEQTIPAPFICNAFFQYLFFVRQRSVLRIIVPFKNYSCRRIFTQFEQSERSFIFVVIKFLRASCYIEYYFYQIDFETKHCL